jgi:hypothetical protein
MTELIVACVRTGDRIPFDCVTTLRNAVARHLSLPYTMVCLTDQPERCSGIAFVDTTAIRLPSTFAKMVLFEPMWRGRNKVIFLDFDAAVIGDIAPLADVPGEFSICENFKSSVMVIGGGMGNFVWSAFVRRRDLLLMKHARDGVDACIKELYPSPQVLQQMLPPDFFHSRLRLMRVH